MDRERARQLLRPMIEAAVETTLQNEPLPFITEQNKPDFRLAMQVACVDVLSSFCKHPEFYALYHVIRKDAK